MTTRIITAAERAARRSQPKGVRWHKKNPDGTRCATCRPIVVLARPEKTPNAQPATINPA